MPKVTNSRINIDGSEDFSTFGASIQTAFATIEDRLDELANILTSTEDADRINVDGVEVGDSTTARTSTYSGAKALQVYTTCASTNGSTSFEPVIVKTVMTGAGQVGGRMMVHMETAVALGGWANAMKAYAEFKTGGKVTGLGSALCVEMKLPNESLGAGGHYFPLEIEHVSAGTSLVTAGSLGGNHTGFITMRASGDADGDFDDNGFLFTITGLTAGTGHLFHTDAATGTIAGSLRIGIGTTPYYIPLWSNEVQAE
jgi:hypothetical protein